MVGIRGSEGSCNPGQLGGHTEGRQGSSREQQRTGQKGRWHTERWMFPQAGRGRQRCCSRGPRGHVPRTWGRGRTQSEQRPPTREHMGSPRRPRPHGCSSLSVGLLLRGVGEVFSVTVLSVWRLPRKITGPCDRMAEGLVQRTLESIHSTQDPQHNGQNPTASVRPPPSAVGGAEDRGVVVPLESS